MLAAALASTSCTLLFEDEPLPDMRFDFEGTGEGALRSSGTSRIRLSLQGGAKVTGGALNLQATPIDNVYSIATAKDSVFDLSAKCVEEKALTISAWLTPQHGNLLAGSPGRAFSIEASTAERNITLGEFGTPGGPASGFEIRVGEESVELPMDPTTDPVHIFFTIDSEGYWRFVMDQGDRQGQWTTAFDNWTPEAPLSFGGVEDNGRPWRGIVHHFDLYCRDFTVEEQTQLKASTDPR